MINQLLKNQKSKNSLFRLSSLILLTICLFTGNLFAQIDVTATGGTPAASYTTLKGAFDAINLGTHTGTITIGVSGNTTETAPAVLNSTGAGAASYGSISIAPTADGVTISGATTTGRGLIELNGADNVTINGDNAGSGGINRNLTLQNTAAATVTYTSVIRVALSTLITSGNSNSFSNLNILGSATGRNVGTATSTTGSENTTYGILIGGGASTVAATTAPSAITNVATSIAGSITATNATISNNSIDACARGISVNGGIATVATGLSITNNIIGNATPGNTTTVYSRGITVQGFSSATISGNTVRNMAWFGATAQMGISVGDVATNGTGAVIERNIVEGVLNSNTSSYGAYGINIAVGSHIIRTNSVSGINGDMSGGGAFSTTFGIFGIRIAGGTNHQIYHNSVNLYGSRPGTATSSLLTTSIGVVGSGQTGCDIRNNIFTNTLTGGTTSIANVSVYLPTGATSAMNLTLNNNAYFCNSTAGSAGVLQRGTTYGAANIFAAADFVPGATSPATNSRSYTSTLSAAGTNDNLSVGSSSAAPFTSSTNLRLDLASPQLTSVEQKGINGLSGVGTDFDGDTRPDGLTTLPDMGIDEVVLPCFTTGTITPSGSTTFCVGSSVDLTAACTANCGTTQSYSWSPSTGLSATTGATVTANPTSTTTYTVTFGSDAGCSSGIATVVVTVNKNPILYASDVTPLAICSGEGATLTSAAGTTSNYTVQSTTYNFETPSGVRTSGIVTGDDAVSSAIALPFTFNYFGTDITNVFAYTNGFVQLGTSSGSTGSYGTAFPAAGAPNNIIAGIWDDLNVTGGGVVSHFTNGVAPNRVFIIEYNAVQFFNGTGNITFQIKLFENGKIEIHYNNVVDSTPSNHFSGIENAGGTIGVPITGRNPFTTDITTSEAWLFMPSGAGNTYAWSPATYLSDAAIANPTATNITSDVSYTLTVTGANGCTVTSPTYDIVVTSGAAITAEPAPLTRCTGQSASFTVGATGPGLTYQWYLEGNPLADGGTISGATSATLTISSVNALDAGIYEVEVFATCGGAVGSDGTAVLTVNQTPTASSGSSASVCAGDDINLVGTSDIGTTFSWTGPNGFTSSSLTDNITSVTALNSGTYTFTASTASCTSVPSNVVMTVNTPQTVTFASQASAATVCPAASVDLSTTVFSQNQRTLGAGLTPSSTSGVTPYAVLYGGYKTQYIVRQSELAALGLVAGNITSLGLNVTSLGSPTTFNGFTISIGHTAQTEVVTNTAITAGLTSVYSNVAQTVTTGVNTYNFSTPFAWDGTSNIVISINYSNNNGGGTTATAVSSDATGFNSSLFIGADNATPACLLSAPASGQACMGLSTNGISANRPRFFITGNSATTMASYTWNDGTSDVGTGSPLNISVPSTTSYTMTALGTDGCSYVDPTPVTVTTLSGATITAEPVALNRCTSENATFTVAATGPGLTYQWYQDGTPLIDGGRISGATTASLTISNLDALDAGIYEVEITATCGSPAASDGTSTLTINQKPSASAGSNLAVCENNTISLVGTSDIGTTFAWSGPNGFTAATASASIPTAAALNAGTYTFTASTASCVSNPATITVAVNAPASGITFASLTDANPVCPAATVNLSTTLSKSTNVTLGAGATTSSANAVTPFRVLFGGYKTQYIIRQSELAALGLTAGNLTSLGLNVTSLGDANFNDFSISIAHTAQTAAITNSAITTGLTQVYSNATQSVTAGVNTYAFSTPFNWDGTSNIVISINYSNNNFGGSTSSTVTSDVLAYTSSLTIFADAVTASCLLNAANSGDACLAGGGFNATSSSRPRFFITGNGSPSIASYTWNDGTTDVGTGNPLNIAVPSTTSYTVTALGADGCSYTDPSAVTVNTSTGAVMVTEPIALSRCSGETATFSVVATGAGLTYQWYQDGAPLADGGRISGATSATLTITNTVTADAGVYEVEITPACGSPIASDGNSILTMTQTPSANAGAPISICVGSDINLVGTTDVGTTFTWTGPNGFSSAIASPSITSADANASGVYTFTTVNGTCSSPASTVNVAVNANPASVVATSSVPDVCLASTFNLGVTANTAPVVLVNETFEGGLGSFTAVNNSTGGTPANAAWTVQANSYNTGGTWNVAVSSNNASNFVLSNSDAQGSGSTAATLLTSQSFSTVGYSGLNLSFFHHFRVSPGTALVQVSEDGISYTTVRTFTTTQGAPTGFVQVNVNLDAYLNKPTLYVRFKYDAAWGYGWAIDNVSVTGSSTYTYAWASNPMGYTSTTQNPTGLTQAATTEYIATVTNSGTGCFASNSVVVNTLPELTPSVTISSDDVDNIISPNTLVTYTATPVNGGSTPSYQWKLNGANVGTNSATYTNSTLSNNDVVSCVMTSNYLCLSTPTATSNNVTMTVNNQLTQIVVVQCGITLVDNSTDIYCNAISGASIYEFRLFNPLTGTTLTIQKPSRTFKPAQVAGCLPGVTYEVSARAFYNFAWSDFGPACNITTKSAAGLTKLQTSQCGITLTNVATDLYADQIISATQYRFRVTNGPSVQEITKTSRTFKMSQLTTVHYGATVTVEVDAFVNGAWIGYGTPCNITMPALPTTKLQTSQCGIVLTTTTTLLYADQVFGATQYRFRVKNATLSFADSIVKASRVFRMSEIPGLVVNTPYQVDVAVYFNGAWQNYGTVCNVTTPAALAMMIKEDLTAENNYSELNDSKELEIVEEEQLISETINSELLFVELSAYPNPNNGEFTISSTHEGSFKIINELGQLVQVVEITKENNLQTKVEVIAKGVYFVTGIVNGEVVTSKIVVQ